MRVLGIDPGTDRVGFAVLDFEKRKFLYITSGILPRAEKNHAEKLLRIEKELRVIIRTYKPGTVGLEKLFFSKNQKTAMQVAEARGVIIKTIAEKKIHCVEITPSEVKLFLTGHGAADKTAVAKMAQKFIGVDLKGKLDDETDAIAIAITAGFLVS